ncbi:MAG: helix-turn-helix transcriptional regulator [Hyphomicrobiaceae bacterium]
MSRTPEGLRRYVGVKEVCDALKISRSTLDRMRREGGFPQHQRISKNRVGWPVEVVEGHLAAQANAVASRAVSDPDKLSPEDIERTARHLAARHLTRETGAKVEPSNVVLGRWERATDDQMIAAGEKELDRIERLFSDLDKTECVLIAAWLLPAYRPGLLAALEKHGIELPRDQGHLRQLAVTAMGKARLRGAD